ncbi:hypothetical protein O9H85_07350 [Paenibacillus filicis]|uniref:Uncharacterized protein n=1 Tax=Paenibacillus gyeongsangnamensis TaxID=3388067 RepID=A0ABT4Q5T6_9BACL|nr:hypothetical protein [Paenibacillus filicis]MCZ8512246.1 hypothetical protein [Paenibacillus filicis]
MADAAVIGFIILLSFVLYFPGYLADRRKRKAAASANIVPFPKRASSSQGMGERQQSDGCP